jgi:hypothetical protein
LGAKPRNSASLTNAAAAAAAAASKQKQILLLNIILVSKNNNTLLNLLDTVIHLGASYPTGLSYG